MKKVLSISLGSSRRDHRVEKEILGEKFLVERRGTNGNKKKAYRLFTELDGKYDAFGMGGIDLYIKTGDRKYVFRDAKKLIKNVKKTPVVDGSGLKDTLERLTIEYINDQLGISLQGKKVLMTAAMDRFGMAEAFVEKKADMICGDLIFALGLALPINSMTALEKLGRILAPVLTKLPFEMVYPTGDNQDKINEDRSKNKFARYYENAEIIAGDFHFINKYIPEKLVDKIIVTNTVTEMNVNELKEKGIKLLITTTPELEGRSFGTNVIEGILVALAEKSPEDLSKEEYLILLEKMNFKPRIVEFKKNTAV